jgi:dihydroorotate dehydrogenase (fumarate)
MGVPLANPIVVGSSSLSKSIDSIKKLEQAGAGGLVVKSLFEEQIQLEEEEFRTRLGELEPGFAEAVSMFPKMEHGGPKQHLGRAGAQGGEDADLRQPELRESGSLG